MRGLTALGGRGFKAIVLSLSALGLIFIFSSFLEEAAPYAKEISETGFYPAHDYDAPSAEPLLPPEVTTWNDEDHPATAKWHSDAMAKIKDKIGSWLPMEKVYGAMIPPPWRDHSKSMKLSSYHAPEPPKEERSVIVGKVSILNNPENEYIDRAVRTHTVHDKRHGYQHYIMREQLSSNAYENFATHMLSVLQAELSKPQPERLEWLYYFPETTIILNPNVPLELFLPPKENSTLASRYLLYPERTTTSTSPPPDLAHTVFAAKIHEWTVDLFTTLVSRATTATEQTQHHDLSSSSNTVMPLPSLLALPPPLSPADHALALPTHWLNCWPPSIPLAAPPSAPTLSPTDPADPDTSSTSGNPPTHQIHRGSFVLDLPLPPANGTAEEGGRWRDGDSENSVVLARRFEHWLARAEARLPLWEAPLEETWYAAEARGFWEGRAAASSSYASASASASVSGGIASPVGYVEPGYTPATGGEGESKGGHSPRVEELKEEVLRLVREMEASVHNWRQEVSEEVRRSTESRCGRAREALAEVELDGSADEEGKVRRLQVVVGGLEKASSRFNRHHTAHARHALLSVAQLALKNATSTISSLHTELPSSSSSPSGIAGPLLETLLQSTLHLQSLLDRHDWSHDEVKAATSAVEAAVAEVVDAVGKQAEEEERRRKAGEIERLRQEEERLVRMEALADREKERERAGLTVPKPW